MNIDQIKIVVKLKFELSFVDRNITIFSYLMFYILFEVNDISYIDYAFECLVWMNRKCWEILTRVNNKFSIRRIHKK